MRITGVQLNNNVRDSRLICTFDLTVHLKINIVIYGFSSPNKRVPLKPSMSIKIITDVF